MKIKTLVGITLLGCSFSSLACTPSGAWGFDGPRLVQNKKSYQYTVKVPAPNLFERERIDIYHDGNLHASVESIPIKQTRDFTLNFKREGSSQIEVYMASNFNCGSISVGVLPNVKENIKVRKTKQGSIPGPHGSNVTNWQFSVPSLGRYSSLPGKVDLKWYAPFERYQDGVPFTSYEYIGSGNKVNFSAQKLREENDYWVRLYFTYTNLFGEKLTERLNVSYSVDSDVWCDPSGMIPCEISAH